MKTERIERLITDSKFHLLRERLMHIRKEIKCTYFECRDEKYVIEDMSLHFNLHNKKYIIGGNDRVDIYIGGKEYFFGRIQNDQEEILFGGNSEETENSEEIRICLFGRWNGFYNIFFIDNTNTANMCMTFTFEEKDDAQDLYRLLCHLMQERYYEKK